MMRIFHDRLDKSGNGLVMISLVTLAAVVVITLLSMVTRRDSLQMTQMWVKYLGLNPLAMIDSGRGVETAGHVGAAIDLRHSPYLPLIRFSPEAVMFGSPELEKGGPPFKDQN